MKSLWPSQFYKFYFFVKKISDNFATWGNRSPILIKNVTSCVCEIFLKILKLWKKGQILPACAQFMWSFSIVNCRGIRFSHKSICWRHVPKQGRKIIPVVVSQPSFPLAEWRSPSANSSLPSCRKGYLLLLSFTLSSSSYRSLSIMNTSETCETEIPTRRIYLMRYLLFEIDAFLLLISGISLSNRIVSLDLFGGHSNDLESVADLESSFTFKSLMGCYSRNINPRNRKLCFPSNFFFFSFRLSADCLGVISRIELLNAVNYFPRCICLSNFCKLLQRFLTLVIF